MSLSSFVFPGYPSYVEAAANELGRPNSAQPAGRLIALTALANLCAQASRADLSDVDAILAKGGEFRDQLATALRAADAMIADIEAARTAPEVPLEAKALDGDSPEASARRGIPRKSVKGASS